MPSMHNSAPGSMCHNSPGSDIVNGMDGGAVRKGSIASVPSIAYSYLDVDHQWTRTTRDYVGPQGVFC
jgi:hypothetical protein